MRDFIFKPQKVDALLVHQGAGMGHAMDDVIVNSLGPYTRPILQLKNAHDVSFFASGALLKMESRFFLITAAHALDYLSDTQPLFVEIDERLVPMRGVIITSPTDEPNSRSDDKIDIGIIELLGLEGANLDRARYLSLDDLDLHGVVDPELGFVFIGYPESKNRSAIKRSSSSIDTFMYGAMCWLAEESTYSKVGARREDNILLHFNKKRVHGLAGDVRTAPNLNALSGAPIWGRDPDGIARVAGILIEHHSSGKKCIVGTKASHIFRLLKELLEYDDERFSGRLLGVEHVPV